MKPIGGDPTLCQTSSFLRFEFPLFGETNFKTIAGFDVSFNNASSFSFPDSRIPEKKNGMLKQLTYGRKEQHSLSPLSPFPLPPIPLPPFAPKNKTI